MGQRPDKCAEKLVLADIRAGRSTPLLGLHRVKEMLKEQIGAAADLLQNLMKP